MGGLLLAGGLTGGDRAGLSEICSMLSSAKLISFDMRHSNGVLSHLPTDRSHEFWPITSKKYWCT